MTKQKLTYASDERMAEIDAGAELGVDILAGTQALSTEYAERIEYLKTNLWDVLGRISQWNPRLEEWPEERVEKFCSYLKYAWHYRQEIRLLTYLARGEVDVTDHLAEWRFYSDKEFGPLPGKAALIN